MQSKNETYQEPDEAEVWTNKHFTTLLNYLCEKKIKFNGQIFLKWLAAPYVSVWNAESLEVPGAKIWIMHNDFATDYFIDRAVRNERDAMREFGYKWKGAALELAKGDVSVLDYFNVPTDFDRKKFEAKLNRYAVMLLGIANDDEVWELTDKEGTDG